MKILLEHSVEALWSPPRHTEVGTTSQPLQSEATAPAELLTLYQDPLASPLSFHRSIYWLQIHACYKKYPCNGFRQEHKPQYYQRTESDSSSYLVFYGCYRTIHNAVPKITLQDVLSGRVQCQKRPEVLAWKSRMPPYCSCIYSCAISKSDAINKQKCGIITPLHLPTKTL